MFLFCWKNMKKHQKSQKDSIQTPHPRIPKFPEMKALFRESQSSPWIPSTTFYGLHGTVPCEDLGLSSSCPLSNPRSSPAGWHSPKMNTMIDVKSKTGKKWSSLPTRIPCCTGSVWLRGDLRASYGQLLPQIKDSFHLNKGIQPTFRFHYPVTVITLKHMGDWTCGSSGHRGERDFLWRWACLVAQGLAFFNKYHDWEQQEIHEIYKYCWLCLWNTLWSNCYSHQ